MTVALALIVLWGLKPWEDGTDDPRVAPLGIEMAVGEGRALPAAPLVSVAAGTIAPAGPRLVVQPAKSVGGNPEVGPTLALAPGQAVVAPASKAAPAPSPPAAPIAPAVPEAQPVSTPTAEPAATPVTAPVVTTTETARPGGPVSAGAGGFGESCEGDEYLLTIRLLDEGPVSDESPVDVVLARINEDGSSDELHLEGDLGDARSLVATLGSEGSCVDLEIVPFEGELGGEEEAEEAPGASEGEAEPVESPVPVSP